MYQNSFRSPIFVQFNEQRTDQFIFQTIIDKTTAAELYIELLNKSPNDFVSRLIEGIRLNNLTDLEVYQNLYLQNFGPIPSFTVQRNEVINYKEAILSALENEIRVVDTARRFLAAGENQLGSDIYRATLLQDTANLSILGTIYNSLV